MRADNLQPITNPTTMQQKALMKQQQQAKQSTATKHTESDNKQPDTSNTPKSPKQNPQGIWEEEHSDKRHQKASKGSDSKHRHKFHHTKRQIIHDTQDVIPRSSVNHSHQDNTQQIWHELDWQARYRDQRIPIVQVVKPKEQAPIGSYNRPIVSASTLPAHLPPRAATPKPQPTKDDAAPKSTRIVPRPPPPPQRDNSQQ